jgi:transposase
VVHAPSAEDEDHRHLHRELEQLKKERTQHRNRIRSILATEGVQIPGNLMKALQDLGSLRNWNGDRLSESMLWRLERKMQRLTLVEKHIKEITQHQAKCVRDPRSAKIAKIADLTRLRGVGLRSSWVLVMESPGWKSFNNRREVGGSVGLVGTPYNSGQSDREQGISKAGNARVRATLVELAWLWIRYQPESNLTTWFNTRYAGQNKRLRRIGIVAVARRLMIQLWHFLEHGVDPPGAIISKAPA